MNQDEYILYCETLGLDPSNEIARDVFTNATSIDQAVNNYLALMEGPTESVPARSSHNLGATQQPKQDDYVPAPLPQVTETLLGSSSHVSSNQRDHQINVSDYVWAQKNLETMFTPPVELMAAGDMGIGRDQAIAEKKWLLINIQDREDFTSLLLNRDIWKGDASIRQLISTHCIFQQHERKSLDGQMFIANYKVQNVPAISFIDPSTLECILKIDNILFDLPQKKPALIRSIEQFLRSHPLPPSAKALVDAGNFASSTESMRGVSLQSSKPSSHGYGHLEDLGSGYLDGGEIVLSDDEDVALEQAIRASLLDLEQDKSVSKHTNEDLTQNSISPRNTTFPPKRGLDSTDATTTDVIDDVVDDATNDEMNHPMTLNSKRNESFSKRLKSPGDSIVLEPTSSLSSLPSKNSGTFFSSKNRNLFLGDDFARDNVSIPNVSMPMPVSSSATSVPTTDDIPTGTTGTAGAVESNERNQVQNPHLLKLLEKTPVNVPKVTGPETTRIQFIGSGSMKTVGIFDHASTTVEDLYVFCAHALSSMDNANSQSSPAQDEKQHSQSLLRPFKLVTRVGRNVLDSQDTTNTIQSLSLANQTLMVEYVPSSSS